MATYYVTAVPRRGEEPDSASCPLMPCDFTADSKADALDQAWSSIAESKQCIWEAHGDDAEAIDRAFACIEQWRPIARRVARPAVALEPRAEIIDTVRGGKLYDYGEATGTESFDVLIDGMTSGRLERRAAVAPAPIGIVGNGGLIGKPGGKRVWLIADARGPLAQLAARRWADGSPAGLDETLRWLDAVLADIRAALEASRSRRRKS